MQIEPQGRIAIATDTYTVITEMAVMAASRWPAFVDKSFLLSQNYLTASKVASVVWTSAMRKRFVAMLAC